MTEGAETVVPKKRTPRKKKYPVEALYAVAGGTFFVVALLMWGSVLPIKKLAQENAQRTAALETAVVAAGNQVTALLATLEMSSSERAELEKAFQEQLGALSADLSTQQSQLQDVVQTTDISAAISDWSPFVYMLECYFTMEDGKRETDRGSATLERTMSGVRLITNRHVIERDRGVFDECLLKKPDSDTTFEIDNSRFVKSDTVDYAYAPITPTNAEAMLFSQRCTAKPSIGDSVLILGYPGIGAKESITATEGIISGFDADYYTTSAKIERGNSGGAAIDIKRNCFLGLPTLVFSGRVESIARILPALGL